MVTAQFADWIDDLIHLPKRHPIHLLVELIEICLYLLVVIGIVFVMALIEHSQNRLSIPEIRWMGFDLGFQGLKKCFQGNTSQRIWVMLPWKTANYK